MELQLIGSLLFLLVSSVLTQQVPLSSRSEYSALLGLRSSLGIRATYWPRKTDPCSNWTGVGCQSGRVVGINLSGLRRTRLGQLNPQFAINSLANFTLLVSFNSSGFSLPGSIPDWFGSSLGRLQRLDLTSCSIIGPIPSSIGAMNRLNYLNLSDNSLTGVIPSTMGNLLSLSILDLSGNLLTGSIPSGLSALGNLTKLDMSSNFLSGSIPSWFGLLSSLQVLKLYNNSFTASIPAELGNVSLLVEIDLGFNSLSGLLPPNLIGLTSLERLAVRNNDLEGPFPSWLLSNPELRVLDISSNNFSEVIPNLTLFFNVTDAVFNFSNNLFYGNLSVRVGRFGLIDLSNNYLQGSAPDSVDTNITVTGNCFLNVQNQRQLEDCRMFYAERRLPFIDGGAISRMQPHRRRIRLTYIMVGLFGGFGFIVILVLVLVIILKTRNKGNANDRGTANVGPVPEGGTGTPPSKGSIDLSGLGESFTYKQMLQATSDFSDTNLIKHGHSGDLFLGKLEGGFSVVIKRVDSNSLGEEFYMMELDLFSKLTHTRMVPLLGHCLEHETEKLLVYKYMPNGDLSSSLHRSSNLEDDSLQSLDWITRLKIAIGAAEALAYLHHECNPPLVHRDVQASSILLDDKYEVRLGSMSEVRAQGGDNQSNVITRLLRIPQISDPGPSGSSSTTCAYDVYCFGKVLLELVTGKLGISNSDDAPTREWLDHNMPFISKYDKELVVKIIDQSLIVDEDLLEEVWAVAIVAKSCLNPKPSKRPLMRHIHRALENPFKVVREENFSPARLTSSRRSWSAAFFGSWHNSSSESGTNKEGTMGALKQTGRVGSQGSGTYEHSSSHKRFSSEIFPEPMDMQDVERQDVGRR